MWDLSLFFYFQSHRNSNLRAKCLAYGNVYSGIKVYIITNILVFKRSQDVILLQQINMDMFLENNCVGHHREVTLALDAV